ANTDCKKLLKSLPNPNTTIVKMVEACNKIGTLEHKYEAMAAAFAAMHPLMKARNCYGCDKLGHLKKNCL
ncbi:GAK6 protein, partial [Upupa epops]|nr:GAK6 protein [Upupa epops]